MRGNCDCCEKRDVQLRRVWYCGIETFACDECLGDDPNDLEPDENEIGMPPRDNCPYSEAEIERSQWLIGALLRDEKEST
jgi:hypothetical protein